MGVVWEDFWRFGSGLGVVHVLRVARLFFRFPLADPEKKFRARAKKKIFPEKKLTKKLWEQGDPVGFLYKIASGTPKTGDPKHSFLSREDSSSLLCPSSPPHNPRIKRKTTTHINEKFKTMSKRHTDSTPDEKAPKRRKLSDSVLVEAARNGDTTAVRVGLEKLSPDTDSKTVAFDAVHEACRGNHDECLALLLPYVETTQMGFGMLLSECIHADHTACTEVLLQHWKSVCSNVAFVPHGSNTKGKKPRPCPAMWEDPAVCQVLIDAGADIETKDERGCSPLLRASISGKSAIVKMLVEAGADVCVTDSKGLTCLMLALIASRFGHTETVRYLVGLKEVDVNHEHINGYTALHFEVQNGHCHVVQVLIDAGADIEAKDEEGRSAVFRASISGKCAVVKMLVEAGADVRVTDNKGNTCLHFAARFGHTEIVRYLVDLPEVDVNHADDVTSTALHCAARQKHPDVVKVLIDAGADIEAQDDDGYSPLFLPSISGGVDTVKVLLRAGADVRVTDDTGNTCLMFAAHHGHIETVRTLLCMPEVGLDNPGEHGSTALHDAACQGHPDVLQALLDAGADIEAKDAEGRSALLVASSVGEVKSAKVLVEAGAEVCATDDEGNTCLIIAAVFGQIDIVRYLLSLPDVDVHDRDAEGDTALHLAAHHKLPDMVKLLLEHGADKSLCNEAGETALDNAAAGGCRECCRLLS